MNKKRESLNKKTPKDTQSKTWPNWQPVGSSHFRSGPDSYGRGSPPANDLIGSFTDTVYAAASLISDTLASPPVKVLLQNNPRPPIPKHLTLPLSFTTRHNI